MENTKQYLITKDEFKTVVQTWRQAHPQVVGHNAVQHVVYNLLREKPIDSGFFACNTAGRIRALNPWYALDHAVHEVKTYYLRHLYTGGLNSPEAQARVESIAKENFKRDFGIDIPAGLKDKLTTEIDAHVKSRG
jgi:hypothetical protein